MAINPLLQQRLTMRNQPTSPQQLQQGLQRMSANNPSSPVIQQAGGGIVGGRNAQLPQRGGPQLNPGSYATPGGPTQGSQYQAQNGQAHTRQAAHRQTYYQGGTLWHSQQNAVPQNFNDMLRGHVQNGGVGIDPRVSQKYGGRLGLPVTPEAWTAPRPIQQVNTGAPMLYTQDAAGEQARQDYQNQDPAHLIGTSADSAAQRHLTGGGPTNNASIPPTGSSSQGLTAAPTTNTNTAPASGSGNIGTSAQGLTSEAPPPAQPPAQADTRTFDQVARDAGYQKVKGKDGQVHYYKENGEGSGKSGAWQGEPDDPNSWTGELAGLYEKFNTDKAAQAKTEAANQTNPFDYQIQDAPSFDMNKLNQLDAATRARYLQEQGREVRAAAEGGARAGVDASAQIGRMGDITSQLAIASSNERAQQRMQGEMINFQSEMNHWQSENQRLMALANDKSDREKSAKAAENAAEAQRRGEIAQRNMLTLQNQMAQPKNRDKWAALGGLALKTAPSIAKGIYDLASGNPANGSGSTVGATDLNGGAQASQAYAFGDTSGDHQLNYVLYGNPNGYQSYGGVG